MFDQSAENPSGAQRMAQGGIIAALYVILTFIFAPISFGAVQVRIAEALTILPMFTSAAVPGLFVGCLLANIFGGAIIWDVVFGSIATLIGAVLGRMLRSNRWLVPIPAVVSNAAFPMRSLFRWYSTMGTVSIYRSRSWFFTSRSVKSPDAMYWESSSRK